ncbi:MAG: SLC13 family permease [Hespellia sp.]|nr:SLC13 family permease [Hespellia sp.]
MNMTTIMAIIMLVVVIALILSKKIPMNFVLFLVPIVIALFLGFKPVEISDMVAEQFATTMKSSGYMLIFGLLYFTMLTESGMFDTIVGVITRIIGDKMNVVIIFILTTVISAIGMLTANISTCYLITFPIMLPLYKKYRVNRVDAFLVTQSTMAAMCFIPWGIGIAMSAMMADCDTVELATASIPWALCFIPVIILEWIYFTIQHKKQYGTLGLPETAEKETEAEKAQADENPNRRPKLFWINFILFIAVIAALAVFKIPAYFVFIVAACVTAMIDYPKDFGAIWNKTGVMVFNIVVMLLAISVYIAVFSQTGMITAFAELITGVFPGMLAKYTFIILLLLSVVVIRFVPYQLYNAMYPLLISIGTQFGYTPIQIIAPYVCNLCLATGVTPINNSIYVAAPLLETEVDGIVKKGVPVFTVVNALVVMLAMVFGILKL